MWPGTIDRPMPVADISGTSIAFFENPLEFVRTMERLKQKHVAHERERGPFSQEMQCTKWGHACTLEKQKCWQRLLALLPQHPPWVFRLQIVGFFVLFLFLFFLGSASPGSWCHALCWRKLRCADIVRGYRTCWYLVLDWSRMSTGSFDCSTSRKIVTERVVQGTSSPNPSVSIVFWRSWNKQECVHAPKEVSPRWTRWCKSLYIWPDGKAFEKTGYVCECVCVFVCVCSVCAYACVCGCVLQVNCRHNWTRKNRGRWLCPRENTYTYVPSTKHGSVYHVASTFYVCVRVCACARAYMWTRARLCVFL